MWQCIPRKPKVPQASTTQSLAQVFSDRPLPPVGPDHLVENGKLGLTRGWTLPLKTLGEGFKLDSPGWLCHAIKACNGRWPPQWPRQHIPLCATPRTNDSVYPCVQPLHRQAHDKATIADRMTAVSSRWHVLPKVGLCLSSTRRQLPLSTARRSGAAVQVTFVPISQRSSTED